MISGNQIWLRSPDGIRWASLPNVTKVGCKRQREAAQRPTEAILSCKFWLGASTLSSKPRTEEAPTQSVE